MQAPRNQQRIRLARLGDLQQLVSREALGHNRQLVGGVEHGAQPLFELLVAEPERQSKTRRLVAGHRGWTSRTSHLGRREQQDVEVAGTPGFGQLASLIGADRERHAGDRPARRVGRIRGQAGAGE